MANRERIICDLDGCEKEYAYRVKGFNLCSQHALGERRIEKQSEDDYLECSISPRSAKWVTDSIVKGRRIALLGIGISICQHGDKIEMRPEIPAIGKLLPLVKKNPTHCEFIWMDLRWRMWP